jgi:hypothetical protein
VVLFFAPHADRPHTLDELRALLAAALPPHLLPARLVELTELPRNRNGKVDRAALRDLPLDAAGGYVPPATDIERTLAGIWSEVLGQDRIGREDNLFERGADSLSVAAAGRRVTAALGVRLGTREVFERPTVRELAEIVAARRSSGLLARLRRRRNRSRTA